MHLRTTLARHIAVLLAALLPGTVHAQDAARGLSLYRLNCEACHTANPATAAPPYNLILTAANRPDLITIASNTFAEMSFINLILTASDVSDIAAYLGTLVTAAPITAPAIEFYNAARDHYFISAAPPEISDLDTGVHPGWQRTGLSFNVYPAQAAGASPVCRFYIPPEFGDSHFYSASPAECAQTQAKFPGFDYESPSVFYIALPDTATGACPAGTVPVYRVWDNRVDTNHRYTTSPSTRERMKALGWVPEGYGPDQVIMCSPQ